MVERVAPKKTLRDWYNGNWSCAMGVMRISWYQKQRRIVGTCVLETGSESSMGVG